MTNSIIMYSIFKHSHHQHFKLIKAIMAGQCFVYYSNKEILFYLVFLYIRHTILNTLFIYEIRVTYKS